MTPAPVLQIRQVRKQYHGLRPLRMIELTVAAGERVALSGIDAGAAEVLVNLVTGASVPDEGEVVVFGESTASITDGDAWLASLDRFGIMTPRAVLLGTATLQQNLAMPLTLDIEPVKPEVAARVAALAQDVGIDPQWLERPMAALDHEIQARAHLARAIALDPALLILEHPTASLAPGQGKAFGEIVARVSAARSLTTLIVSQDADFSSAAATRRLALDPASGEVKPVRRRFWSL
jgi:ABC-type transporter Mla maintaining outer membrane lipid asymmetry ATPase subunit MlaF